MWPAAKKCGVTGPYLPVGDTDWECRYHGVLAELKPDSVDADRQYSRSDFYCPMENT